MTELLRPLSVRHLQSRLKIQMFNRKADNTVKPLLRINSAFYIHFSTLVHEVDLIGAHQPAWILSTAKFKGVGQLASLQCQLSFPEAACSILSIGSELVEVQSTGCIRGL